VYGQSIFLLDEADIANQLKLHLKNLEGVSIDRYYPNGVKVLITGAPILFDTTITGITNKKW
jgi:cell division septal protein FtsQ